MRTTKTKKTAADTKKATRKRGSGTIWEESPGKWRGQITIGIGANGYAKRRSVSGKSREIVEDKLAELQLLIDSVGLTAQDSGITVIQVARQWLRDFKRIEICTKTYEWYENLIDHLIAPQIGGTALYKVTTVQLQNLISRLLLVDDYAQRTVRGVQSCLKQIFDFACQMGMLTGNPATNVKLPKQRRRPRKERSGAIPIRVRTELLAAAESEPMIKAAVTVLMFTGLRVGELLALRWSDVDFDGCVVTVDEAVVRRPVYNAEGDRLAVRSEVAEPKTDSSYRTIRVPAHVIEVLADWRRVVAARKRSASQLRPSAFVFTSSKTREAYSYTGFRTVYYKFLGRHDLRKHGLNLHSYRHTFATMLLENGTSPKIEQDLMGHASVTTTLGIYTHVVPELFDSVASALDGVYEDTLSGSYKVKEQRR